MVIRNVFNLFLSSIKKLEIMAQDVNLTSREWCDLIFEGKNKQYGAYSLRQSSDKRHVSAILAIFVLVCAVVTLPRLMKSVSAGDEVGPGYTDVTKVSEYVETKPKEPVIPNPEMPNTPAFEQVRNSIQYLPPKLVSTGDLAAESNIPTIDNILESTGIIHNLTVTGGSDTEGKPAETANPVIGTESGNKGPVTFAEQFPQFPGGNAELMLYLSKNLKYPVPSVERGIEGKVTVRFVVRETGEISDVIVLQSLDPLCDREAVRLISTMPNWIPGRQNGHPVSVYFTIPVRFKLVK